MIAGTDMHLVEFEDAWRRVGERARRWIEVGAVRDAYAQHCACLMNDDGIVVIALGGEEAFVLLAAATGGEPGAFMRNEGAVATIARDMGARRLAFRSDRRGWERVLDAARWRRSGDLYEREV